MKIDAIIGEDDFSQQIAKRIGVKFIKVRKFPFPDSEIKLTLETEESIKNNKVLLVFRSNRFTPNINENVMNIFFTASLLKEIGAKEIDLLVPYMFYSRQDKQFLPGEIKSFMNIASLYESLGISNIFTINSHLYGKTPNLQSFFRKIKVHDISPVKIFSEYLESKSLKETIVIGPGKGADNLIKEMAEHLDADFEGLEKERDLHTQTITMKPPKANLKNRDVIIYDDISASGGTIAPAFDMTKQCNPKRIFICLPHLVTKKGIEKLQNLNSSELVTIDTFISEEPKKFTELSVVPLITDYIKKLFS